MMIALIVVVVIILIFVVMYNGLVQSRNKLMYNYKEDLI